MPELPEVETLRRSLLTRLPGRVVDRIEVRCPDLRLPASQRDLEQAALGRRVLGLRRRAKYLLVDLEGGWTVVVHLGMSGRLTLVPGTTPTAPHEHVVFGCGGERLRLVDPRRFGLVVARPSAGLARDPLFAHLGPEPLDEGFSGDALRGAAAGRWGPVKTFLMDARVVVGVGNIYASEALFAAGVHPRRSVARIAPRRWQRIAEAVQATLRGAIGNGGTTFSDFVDGEGRPGEYQGSLAVYGREGRGCPRCEAAVRRMVLAGRGTYYCPHCQR